ncbi:uncharacterized [Tachysurus ichikawai]
MNWVTSYGNLQMQYTGTVAMLAQFPTAAEGDRRRKRKRRGQQGRQPTRQYEDRQHARASAVQAFILEQIPNHAHRLNYSASASQRLQCFLKRNTACMPPGDYSLL